MLLFNLCEKSNPPIICEITAANILQQREKIVIKLGAIKVGIYKINLFKYGDIHLL